MPTYNKAVINGTTYLDLSSDTVTADSMLLGTTAHDMNGASITGEISTITLGNATTTNPGSTYTNKQTIARSTSTRYIAIDMGYNPTRTKYTISAVPNMTMPTATSSTAAGTTKLTITPNTSDQYLNYQAGYNTAAGNYKISGDADLIASNVKDGTSIFGVTGTFTDSATVSSGQTAATAAEILEGYSAWVDGEEVQGTATGEATCEVRNGGATWAQCVATASTSVGWREEKYSDGRLIRWAWDYWNANAGDGAKTVAMTAKASDNNGPTAFVDTPECFFFQRSTASTAVSASITLQSWSNTTHTYYVFFSNNGGNRRIAVSTRMEGHWK